MKMIEIGAIVWGVQDIARAVQFWSAALHYKLKGAPSADWAILIPVEGDGVQISLSKVSPRKPGATTSICSRTIRRRR